VSKLVDVNADDCVLDAFNKLTTGRILSVPVYDERRQKYIGFLDVVDIVHHFLKSLTQTEVSQGFQAFKEKFANTHCKELMNVSGRNQYNPVEDDTPLGNAITMMTEGEVHRIPILDGDGELVSLLSQSRIVEYLAKNLMKFPSSLKTLAELKLGVGSVVSVQERDLTVAAFEAMRKNAISGVGVVNEVGALIGVLSVTDLRSVGYDEQLFQRLYLPVHEFIALAQKTNAQKPKAPVTITQQTTFGELLDLFGKTGLHRFFVVDEAKKPSGIVSLTDILRVFAAVK